MHSKQILLVMGCVLSLIISGCAVKTYTVSKDRIDQDLSSGNRGLIKGSAQYSQDESRKTTREIRVFELEFGPKSRRVKSGVGLDPASQPEEVMQEGMLQPQEFAAAQEAIAVPEQAAVSVVMKEYQVLKGDTLQKISKKFYGTTKKWQELFQANKDVLKSPDSIYPGQTIMIPVEEIKSSK